MAEHEVGSSEEVPEGGKLSINVSGKNILLVRSDGTLYAIDGRCSHMGMDLSSGKVDGKTIECRLHHAVFDLSTGEVVRNMAAKDMKTYAVAERDGKIYVNA